MKLSKEKQQQLIAIVIGTVVVVVALWFLVISGQKTKMAKLDVEIGKATKIVSDGRKDIQLKDWKQQIYGERTNKLAELEVSMMPTNDVYSTFRTTLNRFRAPFAGMVEITDVSKERIAPLGMLPNFPYATAIFTVRGTAHYHNFGRFLAELETSYPFYRVQSVSLNASGLEVADGGEKLSFEIDIVTLIKPSP